MRTSILLVIIAGACVMTFRVNNNSIPPKADFVAAGFRFDAQPVDRFSLLRPLGVADLIPDRVRFGESLDIVTFDHGVRDRIEENDFEFIESLPDIAVLKLNNCGLTDDDLRRILDAQPALTALVVDGNELSDAVLPDIEQLARLAKLSIDCPNVSTASLRALADRRENMELVSPTAAYRLVRSYVGVVYEMSSLPASSRYYLDRDDDVVGPQGATVASVSREGTYYRTINCDDSHSHIVLELFSYDDGPKPRVEWSEESASLFECIGALASLRVKNLTPDWQPGRNCQVKERIELDAVSPAIIQWLSSQQSVSDVVLREFVGPETALFEWDVSGTQSLTVTRSRERRQELLHGEFLNQMAGVRSLRSLTIVGHFTGDTEPVFVDFSRYQSLERVFLDSLAIDDRSLASLATLPNLTEVTIKSLPHVTLNSVEVLLSSESLGSLRMSKLKAIPNDAMTHLQRTNSAVEFGRSD